MIKRPLIGCTTYHKIADQDPPIGVYGLMPPYVRAVEAAGGLPVLIPLGLDEESLANIFERLDGLLIPGGGDVDPQNYRGDATHPTLRDINQDRDRVEIALVRQAVAAQKPMLAICRGCQVFNVALGGTLWEDVASQNGEAIVHDYYMKNARTYLAHEVTITPDSRLAELLQTTVTPVNSLHHQGVRLVAPELTVTGRAPDNFVEALEISGHPFALGVQWHPENLLEVVPPMLGLFQGLVQAASNGHR
jgi:putative glutamine amidotransferase